MKWYGIIAVLLLTGMLGCGNGDGDGTATPVSNAGGDNNDAGGDNTDEGGNGDHGHSHEDGGPVLGGHLIDLTSETGDMLPAEWDHDDEAETVSVILLDESEKHAVSKPGARVEIRVKVGDDDPEVFALPAQPAGDDVLDDSQFQLVSEKLVTMVTFGEGAVCTLQITVDGVVYTADLSHDH